MTTGQSAVRVVLGTIGALLLLGGVALALTGIPGAFFGAVWMIIGGGVLLIGVLIEVSRYRSQAAEHAKLNPGPGGGETGPPEPRFQRTEEVFIDPTSNHRMRVWVDASTGERRYVAEG